MVAFEHICVFLLKSLRYLGQRIYVFKVVEQVESTLA